MLTARLPLELKLQADVYLQWSLHTRFRGLSRSDNNALIVLARFRRPLKLDPSTLRQLLGATISPVYEGYKHATVILSNEPELLSSQLSKLQEILGATCFQLGAPQGVSACTPVDVKLPGSGPDIVIGIIDDGCPFAHRRFRQSPTAPDDLAIRFIWDQGGVSEQQPPWSPVPLSYGRFYVAEELQQMVQAASSAGGVDEDSVYRRSGLPSLLSATSHGAHVASLASGWANTHVPRPLAFQNSPKATHLAPPGRKDLAFVQLRTQDLDDPSGMWLDPFALDGIHAIRSYARDVYTDSKAGRVVINLSYGPQTGPHDGTSILETAMEEIVDMAAEPGANQFDLQIVIPSGNNHLQRTHAEFDLSQGGGEIHWWVAPDSQLPAYLEIWLPPSVDFDLIDAALISPAGETVTVILGQITTTNKVTAGTVALPACQYSDRIVILMALMPTCRVPGEFGSADALAPAGRWRVRLKANAKVAGTAHAYLARSDPNLGRRPCGHSGYLDSPDYDPKRYLRASCELQDDQAVPAAGVMARGSMSGIATGGGPYVAAGYCATTSLPALYSSGGPGRPSGRTGPSYAYPSDQSAVLQGVLGGGNRSGVVTRLVGTSFAAPMLARDLWMNPPWSGAKTPPAAKPGYASWIVHRIGNGLRE